MEQISLELHNLNEWLLLRLIRFVTGLKLAYNPDLKRIYILTLDQVEEGVRELIKQQIIDEFKIPVEILDKQIDYQKAVRRNFLNTSYTTRKLDQLISRDKDSAIMGIRLFLKNWTNGDISIIQPQYEDLNLPPAPSRS
ncbi:MAG TPA: hypothetical protein VMV49_06735 [Candidatus Deferrimicrobium sp.]|nr:hypothetical protein [Candidatus Deferrimicrobium sp.]